MVPRGPGCSPPTEDCVIDIKSGSPPPTSLGVPPHSAHSVRGFVTMWGMAQGKQTGAQNHSVCEGCEEVIAYRDPVSWRRGGGEGGGREAVHRGYLSWARPSAKSFTSLYLLLPGTLRGKYYCSISQIWKLRHREVLSALSVLSHLILTAGSRAIIHPVPQQLQDV